MFSFISASNFDCEVFFPFFSNEIDYCCSYFCELVGFLLDSRVSSFFLLTWLVFVFSSLDPIIFLCISTFSRVSIRSFHVAVCTFSCRHALSFLSLSILKTFFFFLFFYFFFFFIQDNSFYSDILILWMACYKFPQRKYIFLTHVSELIADAWTFCGCVVDKQTANSKPVEGFEAWGKGFGSVI